MRPISSAVAVIALFASLTAVSAVNAAMPLKPWLAGYGSWNTYAMGDVNDQIVGGINSDLAGTGVSMDELKNGFGFGVEGGIDVSQFAFGVGYERVSGMTDVTYGGVTVELKAPANAFYALAEYKLPTAGPVGARLGVAGGLLSTSSEYSMSAPGEGSMSIDITGSGPLLKAYLTGEWKASPQFGLLASLGYRYAKVNEPKVDGESITDFTIDYSGFVARAGLRFAFGI